MPTGASIQDSFLQWNERRDGGEFNLHDDDDHHHHHKGMAFNEEFGSCIIGCVTVPAERTRIHRRVPCRARCHEYLNAPGRILKVALVCVVVAGALSSAGAAVMTAALRQQGNDRRGQPTVVATGSMGFVTAAGPKLGAWGHLRAARRRPAIVAQRLGSLRDATFRNYFEVLGVEPSDDFETIKKAYRRLCLENHPDTNRDADAKEKFLLINEAYTVLSDNKRKWMHAEGVGMRSRTRSRTGSPGVWRKTRYVVGDVIGHKQDGWKGVILGIDDGCEASDEWMVVHNVDNLPHGRNQRYFHVLPDIPDAADTEEEYLKGAEILCKEPAFFMAMGVLEDDVPTLNTLYVAEDEVYHWKFAGGEIRGDLGSIGRGEGPAKPEGSRKITGPVRNSLVSDIFSAYRRGRYGHNGEADTLSFTKVVNVLKYNDMYHDAVEKEASLDAMRRMLDETQRPRFEGQRMQGQSGQVAETKEEQEAAVVAAMYMTAYMLNQLENSKRSAETEAPKKSRLRGFLDRIGLFKRLK